MSLNGMGGGPRYILFLKKGERMKKNRPLVGQASFYNVLWDKN